MNDRRSQMVIEVETLAAQEAQTVRILDCRFSLQDPNAPRTAFVAGHIPGAQFLDLETILSDHSIADRGRHPLPQPQHVVDHLAAMGVDKDSDIILYDDSFVAASARAWWMLNALEYRSVRILNGGLQAWKQMGRAVNPGPGGNYPPVEPFAAPADWPTDWVINRDQIKAGAAGLLIDAREQPRFDGEVEPVDPVAGHIPGAVCMFFRGVCDERGMLKPDAAQRERWQGYPDDGSVVFYCGSGVTACINIFSWRLAGHHWPKLYPGGWSEWCRAEH